MLIKKRPSKNKGFGVGRRENRLEGKKILRVPHTPRVVEVWEPFWHSVALCGQQY